MQIDSDDDHDYVRRGGRLVGEFEQMYQKAKDVLWHQDQVAGEPDVRLKLHQNFPPLDSQFVAVPNGG